MKTQEAVAPEARLQPSLRTLCLPRCEVRTITVIRTSQTQRLNVRPSPFNDLPQYKSCLLELKQVAKSASVYKAS